LDGFYVRLADARNNKVGAASIACGWQFSGGVGVVRLPWGASYPEEFGPGGGAIRLAPKSKQTRAAKACKTSVMNARSKTKEDRPAKKDRQASESPCHLITDEEVELYVMGRLRNDAMAEHLGTCPKCASRVATTREHVALMKAAFKEIIRSEKRA
jgi:hypothetical protein